MTKTCFVIGPIGEPGTDIRTNADDFMRYIVSACDALKTHGYDEPVRADGLNEPGRITSQVIKLLLEADLVIADLTGSNANVYYELALRHAIGKPVIHMAHSGTQLSFDVRDDRTIFFQMHSRFAEQARAELAKQIAHVNSKDYKATNPILETAGIISLEKSADPNENALGHVLGALESVSGEIAGLRSAVYRLQTDADFSRSNPFPWVPNTVVSGVAPAIFTTNGRQLSLAELGLNAPAPPRTNPKT